MTACVHGPRFDPLGRADPLDAVSRLERLRWQRRQKAVVADHERFVVAMLQDLAASTTPVTAFTSVASPQPDGADATGAATSGYASAVAAGMVDLRLPGWRICLGGLSGPAVDALGGHRNWRMSAAGRYGPRWWVRIEPGPDPAADASPVGAALAAAYQSPRRAGRGPTPLAGSVTLLATHLLLAPTWPGPGPGRDRQMPPPGPRFASTDRP